MRCPRKLPARVPRERVRWRECRLLERATSTAYTGHAISQEAALDTNNTWPWLGIALEMHRTRFPRHCFPVAMPAHVLARLVANMPTSYAAATIGDIREAIFEHMLANINAAIASPPRQK